MASCRWKSYKSLRSCENERREDLYASLIVKVMGLVERFLACDVLRIFRQSGLSGIRHMFCRFPRGSKLFFHLMNDHRRWQLQR